jgi:TATA-binding protein-associated factor Taf7
MVQNARKKEENPYPPWFFRVLGPCVLSDRSPSGYEFDEDLSDLASERTAGEEEQPTKKRKLEYSNKESDEDEDKEDDEDEDEEDDKDDDEDDSTSERSHADSLADIYYEFKEIREERKRELERERQDILFMIQSESEIESQVNQAYRSFI